jgi:CubicO group peptidase (beta-lactamase class C family)
MIGKIEVEFMFRIILIVCLSLSALTNWSFANEAADRFHEVENTIRQELKDTNTPGAVLCVVQTDRIVILKGFGTSNVETGTPVDPAMLFQIGSLTKTFTAAAILSLADRAKLNLNDPIVKYAKSIPAWMNRITLHDILSHSAGLMDQPDEYGPHDDEALGKLATSLKESEYKLIEPGKAFSYSNPGYALAGYVAQEAANKSYADLVNDVIFQPLGMKHTTFRPTYAMTFPISMGHKPDDSGKQVVVRPFADDSSQWPAGGILSNAYDLSRFAIAFLNEGQLDGAAAIPRLIIHQMTTPHINIPGITGAAGMNEQQDYSYGFFIFEQNGHRILEHAGSMPGFFALMRLIPDQQVAIITLANQENGALDKTVQNITAMFIGEASSSVSLPDAVPNPKMDLSHFSGIYSQPHRWNIEIVVRDGKLVAKQFGREFELTRIGEKRFFFSADGKSRRDYIFLEGANGTIQHLQFALWTFRKQS